MKVTLETLVKYNPFIASALEAVFENNELESFRIISYSPHPLPNGGTSCSWYTPILDTLQGHDHRVNVTLNPDLTVRSVEVYDDDDSSGVPREVIETDGPDMEKWCSSALFNLIFYASCVHGTLHVLHFIMGACIDEAAEASKDSNMKAWAEPYTNGLDIKYQEVSKLLIAEKKASPDSTIITGDFGFGGSQRTRGLCLQMYLEWGKCKTANDFVENFLLRGITANLPADCSLNGTLEQADCLTEYMRHAAYVGRYADVLTNFFHNSNDPLKNSEILASLSIDKFLNDTGLELGDLRINNLSSWIHIMSVTGLLHGGTLSYTRLIAVPEVLQWRDSRDSKWSSYDKSLLSGGLGTLVGMQEGRHVFSASIQNVHEYDGAAKHPRIVHFLEKFGDAVVPDLISGGVETVKGALHRIRDRFRGDSASSERDTPGGRFDEASYWIDKISNIPTMNEHLHNLLKQVDEEVTNFKVEYEGKLVADIPRLNRLGWILSDFCPDGFDGKQLTITTYI